MLHSGWDEDLGFPLELQQVSQVSSLVDLGTQVSSRVAAGESGLLSS